MTTGTAGCTRVKRSRSLDSNMGGEAFKSSERRMDSRLHRAAAPVEPGQSPTATACWPRGRSEDLLVDAVAAHDAPAHRLHGLVHVAVGLEDPAHLAPLLGRAGGRVEVLDVER